jgi:Integrase core domain
MVSGTFLTGASVFDAAADDGAGGAVHPGEQVQMDVKKLGRIPPGGGWRVHGQGNCAHHSTTMVGYGFIHTAIDSYSRLAYSEVLADEKATTAIGFWARAHRWFAAQAITVEVLQTDNGSCYRARVFTPGVEATGARHRRLQPRRPAWNGKVERSTEASLTNGPTCASTAPITPAPAPLTDGCTSTTITEPTPPSEAARRSPTRPGSTSSAPGARRFK